MSIDKDVTGFFKTLGKDFKAFAFKGNLIDMAVGIVIGGAFSGVVTSLVNDIIMPAIGNITPKQANAKPMVWNNLKIGHFVGSLLNFLIIAVALFILIVVLFNQVKKWTTKPAPPPTATTKSCPLCMSTIALAAKKCAFCTADLPSDLTVAAQA